MRFKWPIMLIAVLLIMIATCRNANGQEKLNYGLGGHTFDGKTMNLADGSYLLDHKTDNRDEKLKNYRNTGTGEFQGKGCSVSIEGDYFVVHYDKEAAEHGCAVDLVKESNKIEKLFTVEVKVDDGFACMTTARKYDTDGIPIPPDNTDTDGIPIPPNNNIIPFVYSIDNAAVQELQKGPRYSENNDCNVDECKKGSNQGKCIESTALEIRWGSILVKADSKPTLDTTAWLQPVAEPKNIRLPGVRDGYEDEYKMIGKATVNVNGRAEAEVYNIEGYCTLKEAVPEPIAWQINNDGEHLFVFHLLPQNAAQIYIDNKMTDDPPKGLEPCKSLTIKFHTDDYSGFLVTPTPTKPMSTTTTTTEGSMTPGSTTTGNMTTIPETAKETPTEPPLWPYIAGGIGALVLLIIAAVLIYCFCCRKKKEETEDEESAALEDGNKNTKTTIVDEGNESKVVDEDADAGSRADAKKMSGSATAT